MHVSVDGAELFYSSRGTGPVCLVPSAIGTKPYERQMPQQMSDGRQLVFVDLRGGGQSTGDPAVLTFDQVAADFEAIRVDLGVDKVAIVGHSILVGSCGFVDVGPWGCSKLWSHRARFDLAGLIRGAV